MLKLLRVVFRWGWMWFIGLLPGLDGAAKFYGTVTKKGETDTVRIGNYNLTGDEKNKILAVVMNYNALLEKFSIPPIVMEYYETRDSLKTLITLKSNLENAIIEERQNRQKGNKGGKTIEDDIPF